MVLPVRVLTKICIPPRRRSEHQVEGRLLLDVVVREGAAVLELLAREDQPLLVRRDALLVLDLRLHVVDGVGRLHLQGDGLASQGLHEDLHATAEAEHQVEGRLLLDVVVREGAAVLELLAGEDQALLVRRDALLVLDLRLDVVDRVRRLDLERDGLARQGLDEDLHATAEAEHEVEGRLLLDVVVREGAAVLELLAREDQALLVRRDALLCLPAKMRRCWSGCCSQCLGSREDETLLVRVIGRAGWIIAFSWFRSIQAPLIAKRGTQTGLVELRARPYARTTPLRRMRIVPGCTSEEAQSGEWSSAHRANPRVIRAL